MFCEEGRNVRRTFRETERSYPDSSVVRAPAYVHMEAETWIRVPEWAFYSWTHPTIFIGIVHKAARRI